MSVGVNPPKTPVTKGSNGVAAATVPNVCKMPGPPAPFVPSPLPNIGKSGSSPKGYTKKVKVKGKNVAIKGATFKSMGDMASKGTGGGLISANTHGPTKFITPGSMDVKMEGKNVQLLSDMMLNNCGPSGSPPNSATLAGVLQAPAPPALATIEKELQRIARQCEEEIEQRSDMQGKNCRDKGTAKHNCCDAKIKKQQSMPENKKNPQYVHSDGAFNSSTGQMIGRNNPVSGGIPSRVPRSRSAIVRQAIGFAASKGMPVGPAIGRALGGKKFPDVVVSRNPNQPPGPSNTRAVYDFKFPCPKTKKPKWGDNGKQGQTYQAMLSPSKRPRMITPTMIVR